MYNEYFLLEARLFDSHIKAHQKALVEKTVGRHKGNYDPYADIESYIDCIRHLHCIEDSILHWDLFALLFIHPTIHKLTDFHLYQHEVCTQSCS